MIVTAGAGGSRGLGKMSIFDPTKGGAVSTNVNQVGAMFDSNGKPIDNTTKKWTRPSQTVQTGGAAGGEVVPQSAGGMITTDQMLNNIKNDINKKEANMGGLNSITGGFNAGTRGLGITGAGVQTPVVGNGGVGQPAIITRPTTVTNTQSTTSTNVVQPTNTIIKPGTKVIVAGGQPTGVVQNGVIQNTGVVTGTAVTSDQRIANAKRNAGKLLNKLMEMAYGLTEQEEKYLLEMLDAIGMKETFLSAAGLGTATPINAQVVINAINEMNQIMTANANVTSYNIELANSIYSKLDTLTMEAQAGGYNEADLITVLAELYASGMINVQDASKPNVVFCFNTLKGQIERMLGGVQPNGVISTGAVRPVVNNVAPVNTAGVQTTTVTNNNQSAGKMFTRPVNQIQNRFSVGAGLGSANSIAVGSNFNRGLLGGSGATFNGIQNASGLNFNRTNSSMITTPMGANTMRTNVGVTPVGGVGMGSSVSARVNIGGNQNYFNTANQDINYSNRGLVGGQAGGAGFMGATLRGAGMQTSMVGNQYGGVAPRPSMMQPTVPIQNGITPGYGYNNTIMQGSGVAPVSPIMQYMNM